MCRAKVVVAIGCALMCGLPPGAAHADLVARARATAVVATVETAPVQGTGDAADDPAIWLNAAQPARSAVIGNDKKGALEVYDMAGNRIQRITGGFFGNVDVRRGVATGSGTVDLVVTWQG